MRRSFLKEIGLALILVILLVALLNPMGFLMSDMVLMTTVTCILVVFIVFAVFIWREQARDEREVLHRMLAGRVAFLSGSLTLIIGIIVQSFDHDIDFWLPTTLIVMTLAKIFALVRAELAE